MLILASNLNTEQRTILTICQDFARHADLWISEFPILSVDDNRENAIMIMNILGYLFSSKLTSMQFG